jgi:hypothetical protein
VDEFIGKTGTIFYDNDLGDFRISDGATPGGIALSFGGGNGGNYSLPTATTSVKGGVKIDGSTIVIANQIISVGTVPYSSLSGTPTIPTNNNELTNGAAYITSAALSGLATETYVTTRGYLTTVAYADVTGKPTLFSGSYADLTNKPTLFSGSYADLTNKPTIPTNTNELTNGAGYITSSALTGYATESYVTNQGYITSAALSGYALTTAIPTDISDLTDTQGLLGQGGGGGTTIVTNNIENPFSFSVAGDDSTLREIGNGESIRFAGAGGITITTDEEGKITVTGTTVDLTGYATETYITSQGYITSAALTGLATESYVDSRGYITGLSWNQLTDKPNLAGTYSWSIAGDDSTLREISTGESVKFIGAGGITTSSDAQGNITITGIPVDLTGYATESYVTSRGYITGLSWDQLTNKPNLAGTYTFNIAGTDSTLYQVNADNTIQFKGNGNITVATDVDGVITIDIPSAMVYHSDTAPSTPTIGELWWDSVGGNLYIYYDDTWVISNSYANITDYNQLTGLPDLSVYALAADTLSSVSWNDITDKPNLAGTYTWSIAADDSTQIEISAGNLVKIRGAGGITTSSDADGNITITGGAQDRLTSNARSAVLNSNGTFSLPTLTATPASPQAGQMALADGVSWDPINQSGTSPYMVIYTGTAWIGLAGGVTMDQVYTAILEMGA